MSVGNREREKKNNYNRKVARERGEAICIRNETRESRGHVEGRRKLGGGGGGGGG